MMIRRQHELHAKSDRGTGSAAPVCLGSLEEVREQLPLAIESQGRRFRVVEHDGVLVAHSTVCPHWLGPLDACVVEDGQITCPWHGYRFDVRTGERRDASSPMRLPRAPRVVIEAGRVRLEAS